MLIYPQRQAVLVWPHEASGVQACIPAPRSQTINFKGENVLAIRHGVDETRILRNLGLKVRSPILDYYDWPRGPHVKEPFASQKETAAFLTLHQRCYVLNSMGTGKTLASLWAFDYLRSCGLATRALVAATLSSLNTAWMDSIEEHLPHLRAIVVYGDRKKRRLLLDTPADIYIINHDGVGILEEELRARADIDLVIIDELADAARNMRTAMWRAFDSVVNAASYQDVGDSVRRMKTTHRRKNWVWGLTGTPIPNAPTDAYAQAKLITPETAPARFTWFKAATMKQLTTFRWRPKEKRLGDDADAIEIVHKTLVPAVRFSLKDTVDLPPTIFMERHVPLTKDQQKAYDAMRQEFVAEAVEGKITAANEGVKTVKLLQIATGIVRGDDGILGRFDATPRLEETLALIKASESGKALVFVPFTAVLKNVAEYLRKAGRQVAIVYGDVGKSERDQIFGAFQHGAGIDTIVCHPKVMAHSLTLTAASTSIWFAPFPQAGIYEQANARTPRPGQTRTTVIANIGGTPLERRMYDRLKSKQAMQGILLDMVRGGRE